MGNGARQQGTSNGNWPSMGQGLLGGSGMANRAQMPPMGGGTGMQGGQNQMNAAAGSMSPGQQMRAAGGPMDGMRGASSYAPGFQNRPDMPAMGGGKPMGSPMGGGMPGQIPQPGWAGGTQIGAQDRGGGIVGGAAPPIDPRLLALMQQKR